ncbi:MAG: hypothetical protein JNL60_16065 [Bacteroidia bacterium]|nr:hypothetical protein [Bacteroidia bacterium]
MSGKIINSILLVNISLLFSFHQPGFKQQQITYKRVKTAYTNTWDKLQMDIKSKNIDPSHFEIYLRIFKHEAVLEAWIRQKPADPFVLLKSYAICAKSGVLGPKRKQGDGQVPEGFYDIVAFQPQSNYHLALKVGYPNTSDRILAGKNDPGGDIMIHGNCVTIGCIPIQDQFIEELYVLCVESKSQGQKIKADLYPLKFQSKDTVLLSDYSYENKAFWRNLRKAYFIFEQTKIPAKVGLEKNGTYLIDK